MQILLLQMLNVTKEYVRTFKNVNDIAPNMNLEQYYVRIYNNVSDHCYDPLCVTTLGAIVCGDDAIASDTILLYIPNMVSAFNYG